MAERIAEYVDPEEFMIVFKAGTKPKPRSRQNYPAPTIIPIAELLARGRGTTAKTLNPFGALDVGEAFISPNPSQNEVSSLKVSFCKRHPGMQFTVPMTDDSVLVIRIA